MTALRINYNNPLQLTVNLLGRSATRNEGSYIVEVAHYKYEHCVITELRKLSLHKLSINL